MVKTLYGAGRLPFMGSVMYKIADSEGVPGSFLKNGQIFDTKACLIKLLYPTLKKPFNPYCMKTCLFVFLNLIALASLAQKKQPVEPADTVLATYLQHQFYSENFADSCYTGIHFIEISFSKGSTSTFISGNLNSVYKKRIESLLADPLKIWDKRFVDYFKKNKIHIVLPVLFVINANCYRLKDSINAVDPLNKATVNELAIKILNSQSLTLKQSFNQIQLAQKGKAANCILVAPCTISSRLNKQKVMM
jgi:hypothetical protein